MPQVSKYKLDSQLEQEIFNKFWLSISQLKNAQSVSEFFSDLLSDLEKIMLAKRFMIAVLIIRGKTAVEIRNILHVSFSTIGSVASWIKYKEAATSTQIEKIMKTQDLESVFDKFNEIVDNMPNRYGTNWELKGKEKYKDRSSREIRKSLR